MHALHPEKLGLDPIATHTAGLAEAGRRAPLDRTVPNCDGWTTADLLWHMLEVQWFWTSIVTNRPAGPDAYEPPSRPADDRLADRLLEVNDGLIEALTGVDPGEKAWSWAPDPTVGFTLRRQTHEALIHHVDGLLVAEEPIPAIDPLLAADGVDELMWILLSMTADAETERTSGAIEVLATDTSDRWRLAFAASAGPGTDDDAEFIVEPGADEEPSTIVSGSALDLDLWLWGRGSADNLDVGAEPELAERLRSVVVARTQ